MEHFSNSSGHFDGFFGCYYLKVNFRIRKKMCLSVNWHPLL